MLSDEEAFLAAIRAAPQDDTPRLVYADWLEERGDPRAELIRVQCALEGEPPLIGKAGEWVSEPELCSAKPAGESWKQWFRKVSELHDERERRFLLKTDVVDLAKVAELEKSSKELLASEGPPVWGARTRIRGGVEETQAYRWMPVGAIAARWCKFKRGMVEEVELDWATWLAHEESFRSSCPLTRVIFTTGPVFTLDASRPHVCFVRLGDSDTLVGFGVCVTDMLSDALKSRWPGITFEGM